MIACAIITKTKKHLNEGGLEIVKHSDRAVWTCSLGSLSLGTENCSDEEAIFKIE